MIIASSIQSGWNCIFENTAGIVFLGTPHGGSPLASAASSISKCIPGSSQLLPLLQADSKSLAQIARYFNYLWESRPVFSFRETTLTFGFMVSAVQFTFLVSDFLSQILIVRLSPREKRSPIVKTRWCMMSRGAITPRYQSLTLSMASSSHELSMRYLRFNPNVFSWLT